MPLYYFKTHGVDDPRTWLKETYFTGTHEGAIEDVLDGKADIGAAKNTVFLMLAKSDPRVSDELSILAGSPNVPENALCVRSDLDESLKRGLRDALLDMDKNPEGREILHDFGAARFIPTSASDYAPVFAYAKTIGLDLDTYDYLND